ncbi:MAG TPA: cyclase family protein [Steroidobacteraceae bacterium]|nr:cyclase family protein [Steroidobacteraceae bacterium]
MIARVATGAGEVTVDLARPIELAIALEFDAAQPRHFGAPPARSQAFVAGAFEGDVTRGASCNCRTVTLTPHCNGTHTECVGHLTREPLDAHRVAPRGLLAAVLVSVAPESTASTEDSSDPFPLATDELITRRALLAAWQSAAPERRVPFVPHALVVRTLPNDAAKRTRDYSQHVPPYFSREAAEELVTRGIEHLVLDTPSLDRTHDQGRLTAHRIFFGLPQGSHSLGEARRAHCTVTELAFVPDEAHDGAYLLALEMPALGGDAVPSRPLLYRPLA